ncbi:uncharacterized protein LOC114518315 [Dendronephthya gigantea]|uniref:uncharacterized protein LOC114518315 n=1 Tax=Dendronephthya gigantea TaxID=151771 RepID=UPI001069F22E|nr:uncharacterized protein LOC114518315 [Dendronephthya gigantea]
MTRLGAAAIMKGALVILVFLQLVVLNEGIRKVSWPKKFIDVKPQKTCPRDPKLDAIRKALELETRSGGRKKRAISAFPANCIHAAIVEVDKGVFQFFNTLYECCENCSHPDHTICNFQGHPEWLCASRAHKCICDCRKTHVDGVIARAKKARKPSWFRPRPSSSLSDALCKKTLCTYGRRSCCTDNQCIRLYPHKNKSPARP